MTKATLRKKGIPYKPYFKTHCRSCGEVTLHNKTFTTFEERDGRPAVVRYGPCLQCFAINRNTWNEQIVPASILARTARAAPQQSKKPMEAPAQ